MKKIVYAGLCLLFMGIGLIGVVLPILPTTPFLLLASYFGVRSSQKFESWFVQTKLYKESLEPFLETRSMQKKTKFSVLVFASSMMALAFIFSNNVVARIAIVFIVIVKYCYFYFYIETVKP